MPGLVPGIHVFLLGSKTWMAGTSPAMTETTSLIHPHVLVAEAVVGRVRHDGHVLHVGCPASALVGVIEDRPRNVRLQLLVDLPSELLALGGIDLLGLRIELCLQVLVAVVGVVALGAATEVLVEGLVR